MIREERRRYPRYYAPESFTAVGEFPPRREYRLKVKDIGINGLCFVTELNLSREAIFKLSFEVTDKAGEVARISTPANILWYTYEADDSSYTAGAQFLGLKDADREVLQAFLETLRPKSGG